MKIAAIQKFSTIDYPQRASAVLFTPMCNYSCFYCHNKGLLSAKAPLLLTESVLTFLKSRVGLLDAVVISGGEPTLQRGLLAFLKAVRALGFLVKLDTNGSRPGILKKLADESAVDYVAVDLKAPPARYMEIAGANAMGVFESFDILMRAGIPFEVRTTVVPLLEKDDLTSMAGMLHDSIPYFLQPYNMGEGDDAYLKGKKTYTPSELQELLGHVVGVHKNTFLRV